MQYRLSLMLFPEINHNAASKNDNNDKKCPQAPTRSHTEASIHMAFSPVLTFLLPVSSSDGMQL